MRSLEVFLIECAEVTVKHLRYLTNNNPLGLFLCHILSFFSSQPTPTHHPTRAKGNDRGLGWLRFSFVWATQPYTAFSCSASPFSPTVGWLEASVTPLFLNSIT